MSDSNQRPIIKKVKKVSAGGHHGGAWKVAYADFVTAMMAFFMLMWLLNATTETQRKGLADYFNPTIPLARVSGGGEGAFGGETIMAGEIELQAGTGGLTESRLQGFGDGADAELAEVMAAVLGRGGDSVIEDLARRNVTARISDEGLVIELFDLPGSELFEGDGATPTPLMERLIATVVEEADRADGGVALAAHMARAPLVQRAVPVWEMSRDRADALRRLIVAAGLEPARLRRVTSHGDRSPSTDPAIDPRNNRVEIILLRNGA
ncbi:flagellar motor protein MotB [Jannaschia sp. LMIT008]|uniref:flagellar motor protein MotB n=1 Tax=Jannaschia maritima TaxID=3032585 RepID=UPI002811191D|nr:flagellar motor protein MotB [Jannaschia sp. LMIT008]